MNRFWSLVVVSLVLGSSSLPTAQAELKLPSIISEGMVLQRDQQVPIWGWDTPGQAIQVSIQIIEKKDEPGKTSTRAHSQLVAVRTNDEGQWMVKLAPLSAGTGYELAIKGSSEITFKDVAVGEVWLCSGQSNMEWTVNASDNPDEEKAAANYPHIRHIKIPHTPAKTAQENVPSDGWKAANPQTVGAFTAVGYFFGRELHKELDVPIGLIGSNWGGTRIEPWTPPVGFETTPALKNITDNLSNFPAEKPDGGINHQSPLALYNGMIAPLVPYGIRGAIWYQGESNRGEGMQYFEKKKALINGWRTLWNNPEMPFYFVQLAPFKYGGNNDFALPEIWEAQTASLSIPHTGMAVTVDIGNTADIHPRNKQDVGKRLALWALAKTYGREGLVYSGPLYKSMEVQNGKIIVHFDHVGDGLMTRDGEAPSHFEIAGANGEYVAAQAKIDGDTVVVWAEGVAAPKAVRYGWHQLAEPNLGNRNKLPASPFRAGEN